MPGRVVLTTPVAEVAAALGTSAELVADEPPRLNIAPQEQVLVCDRSGLRRMRWGIVPVGRVNARGRPVMETIINARSETVFSKTAFAGTGRGVVPANGWYEWTGERRRKTVWRITPRDGGLLFFAAITDVWESSGGLKVEQVATVTCEPNADVEPVHHRMAVILAPQDVGLWLEGTETDAAALMRSWPAGLLDVKRADPETESALRG